MITNPTFNVNKNGNSMLVLLYRKRKRKTERVDILSLVQAYVKCEIKKLCKLMNA